MSEEPTKPTRRRGKRLTPEQHEEIRQALLAGEKQLRLAEKYGVTKTTIYHINVKLREEFGDETAIRLRDRIRRIRREDWDEFVRAIRKTTPEKEGIEGPKDKDGPPWDVESATRFGEKFFHRVPPPARLISALNRAFPTRMRPKKPEPPKRITPDMISPDLRENKRFVEYITSETYWKIQQKEYEDALKFYEEEIKPKLDEEDRIAEEMGDDFDDDEELFDGSTPLEIPEHLKKRFAPPLKPKKKGPAFTKPKRRKKKKKK